MAYQPHLGGGWSIQGPPRRPGSPFLHALIGAVIGGLVALAAAPAVLPYFGRLAGAAAADEPRAPVTPNQGLAAGGQAPGAGGAAAPAPRQQLPPPSAEDLTVVEVVQRVSPAVVGVVNFQRVTNPFTGRQLVVEAGYGTGLVLDERGFIVTNFHVVENAVRIEVALDSGERVEAELVAHDYPFSDLAILRIDPAGHELVAARLGDSSAVQVGETVLAIGNPRGLDFFQSV
ncbi:MAG TPA: S1C family serine protease, partial [Bacillota bacterium]